MTKAHEFPEVRDLTVNDIFTALAKGVDDFRTAPIYGLVVGGIYMLAGWALIALLIYFGLPYLAYPMAMGFALIAPFAGLIFYAVSEHLERNKPLSWGSVMSAVKDAAQRDLRWMAVVTGFALVIWLDMAAISFFAFMGFESFGPKLLEKLFTTPTGLIFLVLGNLVGAIIALCVFSISAVSFPMLYDRDVDFVTAMVTSVRLVLNNPVAMVFWCGLIGLFSAISIVTAFLGLIVMLPIVGHASWHVYTAGVAPAGQGANAIDAGTEPAAG